MAIFSLQEKYSVRYQPQSLDGPDLPESTRDFPYLVAIHGGSIKA